MAPDSGICINLFGQSVGIHMQNKVNFMLKENIEAGNDYFLKNEPSALINIEF